MNVLQEILEWSQGRPAWQCDALRRLMVNGELSQDDIGDLVEICKSAHGLSEQQAGIPLAKEHIPERGTSSEPVTLISIFHHRGVNALAEDQMLKFAPTLTVVYGDNAAGKTGYIRILKSACRARRSEEILGNVISGTAPQKPVVAINYKVGIEENDREWSGDGDDEFVSRVSIFDTQCAAVYLTEKTDVAFRPFGLDLFDKLVKTCKLVRSTLEREQRALASNTLAAVQAAVPKETTVANLLAGITSLTNPERVQALARLSPQEGSRLALLEKSLLDLQANDPEKLARQLTLRSGRVRAVAQHLKALESVLSDDAVATVIEARTESRRKAVEAQRFREATFPARLLRGTGSEPWTDLWESARRFSQELAYPGQEFPVVDNGAQCVLCQQTLGSASSNRLKQFESFIASTMERELRDAKDNFARLRKSFDSLKASPDPIEDTVKEIRIDHEVVADTISAALAVNEGRRKAIALNLASDTDLAPDCPALVSVSREADRLVEQLEERVRTLRSTSTDDNKMDMTSEAQELRARNLLAQHEKMVLSEIERKKKIAAYELCLNDTKTHMITQKSTIVTRAAVTQKLKNSFQDELANLSFRHVEVELKEVGGVEGVLYHKLILTRAPGVDLPRVVSEGEQRCLSIAAFFAELSTTDDLSSIVFDDPVSSLDYKWREGVAQRLIEEAKKRQVIVFTHDIVFLLHLKQLAEEQMVQELDQHIRQLPSGAGVCAEEMPWVASPVKKKIGYLKNSWQAADRLFREGHQSAYEKEAKYLYGLLREAWERALEEVLLGGIVERFRPGVQTQQVTAIADITEGDCRALETAMTKCSKWLPGHDQAAAARAEVPEPDVLKADIEGLENWIASIRKRRSK